MMPDLKPLVDRLRRAIPGLIAVYRHGSFGTGDERPDSDLDVAVLAVRQIPLDERLRLAAELADLAGREVDLLDLMAASTVARVRVIDRGECVFERDEIERRRFEMQCLSAYAMLNEERGGIVADALERGSTRGG
jgi:predicted nucleotidyltransferase